MPPKKRFIAGAACPACDAVDKIYVLTDGAPLSRHCVACGFEEQLGETGAQTAPGQRDPDVSAVRIVQPISKPDSTDG